MIEGFCKLKSFKVRVGYEVMVEFMQECFRVNADETMLGTREYNYIYGSTIESVEVDFLNFYSSVFLFWTLIENTILQFYVPDMPLNDYWSLCHIDGDLKTALLGPDISFEMCDGGAKPDEDHVKVKMNRHN